MSTTGKDANESLGKEKWGIITDSYIDEADDGLLDDLNEQLDAKLDILQTNTQTPLSASTLIPEIEELIIKYLQENQKDLVNNYLHEHTGVNQVAFDTSKPEHTLSIDKSNYFKLSLVPESRSQTVHTGAGVKFKQPTEETRVNCTVSAKILDEKLTKALLEKLGDCEARCKSVAAAQKLINSAGPMVVKIKFVFDENSPISKADQDKIQQMLDFAKAKFAPTAPKAST